VDQLFLLSRASNRVRSYGVDLLVSFALRLLPDTTSLLDFLGMCTARSPERVHSKPVLRHLHRGSLLCRGLRPGIDIHYESQQCQIWRQLHPLVTQTKIHASVALSG
jgi:hypothetical protein